jgi:Arc/MetJ family transcription regulator
VRRKTTIYIEDDLLRAIKIAAERAGKRDYQVVEEALRAYLGSSFGTSGKAFELSEDETLDLAYQELYQSRRS